MRDLSTVKSIPFHSVEIKNISVRTYQISDAVIRVAGSNVSRFQLKSNLIFTWNKNSSRTVCSEILREILFAYYLGHVHSCDVPMFDEKIER